MQIESDSYYAKTSFIFVLILLQVVAGFSLALSLALSLSAYAAMMLMFFGVTPPTIVFAIGALSLVGTYLWIATEARFAKKERTSHEGLCRN